ncbi:MAG: galactose oxidase [Gemmatimonadota bacterium]
MTPRHNAAALLLGLAAAALSLPTPGLAAQSSDGEPATEVRNPPPLPVAVTNNAVASLEIAGRTTLFSFLGLGASRTWDGVTQRAFAVALGDSSWTELPPVPGPRGRIAATAEAVGGVVVLFGGYTVAPDGSEKSVPNVDIWDPAEGGWRAAAPMPVPVDDAVSGVWRDSLIYLVSGWHDGDNVSLVQVYDVARDSWQEATPIEGVPVFGHAGGVAGDAIVFIDGVRRNDTRPRYTMAPQAWRGDIDPADPTSITWRPLPEHPGPALYRAASGVCGDRIVFAGGTDNPYNYDGIGYDGRPAAPRDAVFAYDVGEDRWVDLGAAPASTMDHRGLPVAGGHGFVIGGMRLAQRVSAGVVVLSLPGCG